MEETVRVRTHAKPTYEIILTLHTFVRGILDSGATANAATKAASDVNVSSAMLFAAFYERAQISFYDFCFSRSFFTQTYMHAHMLKPCICIHMYACIRVFLLFTCIHCWRGRSHCVSNSFFISDVITSGWRCCIDLFLNIFSCLSFSLWLDYLISGIFFGRRLRFWRVGILM